MLFKIFGVFALFFAGHAESVASELCKKQLAALKGNENVNSSWAVQMLGSWSNFDRKNFLRGNTFDFGDFEKCVNINEETGVSGTVNGQYCLVQFRATSNRTFNEGPDNSFINFEWKKLDERFGGAICIPASCSQETVKPIMEDVFHNTDLMLATDYDQKDFCKTSKHHPRSTIVWTTLALLITVLTTLAILQTSHDIAIRKFRNVKPEKKFIMFSCYTNGLNLFNTAPSHETTLQCLDGIKVLSTIGIIAFHSTYHRKFFPLTDSRQFGAWEETLVSFITFGCHYVVEAFFVISGALAAKAILKDWKNFSFAKFYFLRFMRITPALLMAILISNSVFYMLVTTAPYAFHKNFIEPCETNWWMAMLHVQNYMHVDKMCLTSTWYLSVDFQMFIIAPFVIYPVLKFGIKGSLLMIAMISFSMLYTYEIAYQKSFLPNNLDVVGLKDDFFRLVYFPTHIRGAAFLIGVLLGCCLEKPSKTNFIIKSRIVQIMLWGVPVIMVGQSFGAKPFFILAGNYLSRNVNALLIACFRNFYSLGIAFAIYMCHMGMGGFINTILSWKYFKPFSRLSLSLYLVHPIFQTTVTVAQKHPMELNQLNSLYFFAIDLCATFVLSIFLFLLVEAPFIEMGKYLAAMPSRKIQKLQGQLDTKI